VGVDLEVADSVVDSVGAQVAGSEAGLVGVDLEAADLVAGLVAG
jgi:hypothetical protein